MRLLETIFFISSNRSSPARRKSTFCILAEFVKGKIRTRDVRPVSRIGIELGEVVRKAPAAALYTSSRQNWHFNEWG